METVKHMPKVSVCVVTYNPDKGKLMETLESIVKQKYDNLQIVLSDDGSKENFFDEAKTLLDGVEFTDYQLLPAADNQGTVKNVEKALLASNGVYIKTISPGDCLTGDTILADWVSHLVSSGRRWSFSDAIYYTRTEDNQRMVRPQMTHPQIVDCYVEHDDDACRWNYIVHKDLALGAAILCERELMLSYLQQITGKVIYAEDNIFRMMMYHGIVPDYFPEEAVLYEFGFGVSTNGSMVWSQRIQADWEATDNIMLEEGPSEDPLQQKLFVSLQRKNQKNRLLRKLERYAEKGSIRMIMRRRFHRRMSCGEVYFLLLSP